MRNIVAGVGALAVGAIAILAFIFDFNEVWSDTRHLVYRAVGWQKSIVLEAAYVGQLISLSKQAVGVGEADDIRFVDDAQAADFQRLRIDRDQELILFEGDNFKEIVNQMCEKMAGCVQCSPEYNYRKISIVDNCTEEVTAGPLTHLVCKRQC